MRKRRAVWTQTGARRVGCSCSLWVPPTSPHPWAGRARTRGAEGRTGARTRSDGWRKLKRPLVVEREEASARAAGARAACVGGAVEAGGRARGF